MAKFRDSTDNASWPYAEELLEEGDPLFVREIRRITDADRLGNLASRWFTDPRPAVRELLLAYLDEPLNAYRHEALVKRLFKLAEKAGDDEVMAAFLVLFDRSIRRVMKSQYVTGSALVSTQNEAKNLASKWREQGYQVSHHQVNEWTRETGSVVRGYRVYRTWYTKVMRVPDGTTMWRGRGQKDHGPRPISEEQRQALQEKRLFSLATRRYLRRRAWRYFRKLGKEHRERYVAAVLKALKSYRDEDVVNGVALLDNWGLVHILFHHCPVLRAKNRGWTLAPGRGLSELAPAPIYEGLWKAAPRSFLELLREGRCRPVRQWAAFMIRRDHSALLQELSTDELFALLAHQDPTVASLAAEVLRALPDLTVLGVERLLELVEEPRNETLEIVCDLLAQRLGANKVTLAQAVRLARSRPLPAARLGFTWLQTKTPANEEDCRSLLGLAEAPAEPLRPEMVRWCRGVLSVSPFFRPDWVLEFLDSRHGEVRAEGWSWLEEDRRLGDNVDIWRKLLESPYDDVRLRLIKALQTRVARREDTQDLVQGPLDEDLLRFVWASVLLNIYRGGRIKPLAVAQLVARLKRRPQEARDLLPILAVALRSVRGPEWRAGLAGVVQLVEHNRDLRPLVQEMFPELKMDVTI